MYTLSAVSRECNMNTEVPRLKIDTEPRRVLFTSEPYVLYTPFGYQPVAEVIEQKHKRSHLIYISARSLSKQLEYIREENGGNLIGTEVWIRKESDEKTSSYIVEE